MRVKCLAQEHNTMSPARPRTRTTRSRVERTNHEATAPPTMQSYDLTIRYQRGQHGDHRRPIKTSLSPEEKNAISRGSRDGAVVRALASYQCGPGSLSGPGIICGLSLFVDFFSGYSGFPLSSKTNNAKFQFDPECTDTC